MVGRQLPVFSLIVPVWLVAAYDGWRGVRETWPALLVAGLGFAVPQFLIANFHGPWLVDVVAAIVSMASLALFLRVWRPAAAAERTEVAPGVAPGAAPDVAAPAGSPIAAAPSRMARSACCCASRKALPPSAHISASALP
jgi:lactate permease